MTVHGTNTARMLARDSKKKWYVPDERCTVCGSTVKRLVETNECSSCHPELLEEEIYLDAKARKKNFYYSTEKCEECGKTGDRWVINRLCVKCFLQIPRTAAIEDVTKRRESTDNSYESNALCNTCKTRNRWVSDRECVKCNPRSLFYSLKEETIAMMAYAPEMIISRKDAIKYHLQVFRPGNVSCLYGHTGFLLVSPVKCIDCLKKGDI